MQDSFLDCIRNQIDNIDSQIIELISARFKLIIEIADFKKNRKIPMMQPKRVEQVISRCSEYGELLGINQELLKKIYQLIIAEACAVENKIINADLKVKDSR